MARIINSQTFFKIFLIFFNGNQAERMKENNIKNSIIYFKYNLNSTSEPNYQYIYHMHTYIDIYMHIYTI